MCMTTREQMQEVLNCLNSALNADPDAINKLIRYRVECSEKLADHETIEVRTVGHGPGISGAFPTEVGMLGVINGILRAADIGTICAVTEPLAGCAGDQALRFEECEPIRKRVID